MKMKNVLKVGIGVLLFLLLGLVSWKIFIDPIDGDDLMEEEANDIAKERFNGEILETKLVDDIYHMTIKLDTGEYELKIASKSGAMMDLVRKKEETQQEEEEPPKNITSEEDIQIALDTVYGEVDDVDLEDEDGQLYYFIEIETEDDLEAEIQIHAISGEVISIEWDD